MWWVFAAGCTERMEPPGEGVDRDRVVQGTWTETTTTPWSTSPTFDAAFVGEEIHAVTTIGYTVYAWDGRYWAQVEQPWTPVPHYAGVTPAIVVSASLAGTLDADGAPCVAFGADVVSGDRHDLALDCGTASVPFLSGFLSRAQSVVLTADGPHASWVDGYRAPSNANRALGTANDLVVTGDPVSGETVWAAWLHDDQWLVMSDLTHGDWLVTCTSMPCPGDTVLSTEAESQLAIAASATGHVAVVGVVHWPAVGLSIPEAFVLTMWEDGGPPVELVRWNRYYPDLSNPFTGADVAYNGETPIVAFSHEGAVEVVALDGDVVVREVAKAAPPYPWTGWGPVAPRGFELQITDTGAPRILTTDHWLYGIRVIERSAPLLEVEVEPPVEPDPVLAVADLVPGDLVVTEVLANPAAAEDAVGEWIEVYVPGASSVDLDGLVIEDEAGGQGTVVGSLVVAPGGYAVLGRSDAARFTPADIAPDAFYGDQPALNNASGDLVRLVGPGGVLDETARYTRAANGRAWQLSADATSAVDNDDPSRWCRATLAGPGGDRGTPGAPNDGC